MGLVNEHIKDLNVPVTNPTMFCDNKTTIYIAYNHKINNQSEHIIVANSLVREKVQTNQISLLQVKSA
jgi:hypothetical protein